jgi:hypothetical protein
MYEPAFGFSVAVRLKAQISAKEFNFIFNNIIGLLFQLKEQGYPLNRRPCSLAAITLKPPN